MSADTKPNKQERTDIPTQIATRHRKAIRTLTVGGQNPADGQLCHAPVSVLASELLAAVDRGSAPELLQQLSRILAADRHTYPASGDEQEGLMLLQEVADHLRTDLELMLMEIYQHLESSRACLGLIRHLAKAGSPATPLASRKACRAQKANVLPWPESNRADAQERQMFATNGKDAKDLPPETGSAHSSDA